jgi:MoxR-like ATPase
MDQATVNNQIAAAHETIDLLRKEVGRVVVGQQAIVDRLVIALLIRGHVLVEGLPGLAKTLLVKTLAAAIDGTFKRIQFTPDLLPADITGTMIFDPAGRTFNARLGPIFANFVLGDEINRAPAKVQSALLEAMQERQVTIGDTTYALPEPFVVIATQNPIEHVGTFPLPESQLDRFLMKLTIGYPNSVDEKKLLRAGGAQEALEHLEPVLDAQEVAELQERVATIHMNESLVDYLMHIVHTTRSHPEVALGVSTRGALTCFKACQALAMVSGRDFVIPEDIKRLAGPVLSHRIVMKDRRGLRGDSTPEQRFIARILTEIPVPR